MFLGYFDKMGIKKVCFCAATFKNRKNCFKICKIFANWCLGRGGLIIFAYLCNGKKINQHPK